MPLPHRVWLCPFGSFFRLFADPDRNHPRHRDTEWDYCTVVCAVAPAKKKAPA